MISIKPLFSLDAEGWCTQAVRASCTNFDARPENTEISLLVIHNISLPPGQYGGSWIEELFANKLECDAHPYFEQLRGLQVSAHFLIRRDGQILQFVSTRERAWHAGQSAYQGRTRCNDYSIGIELEGSDFEAYTDAQYQALINLTLALALHHPLTDVVGHQHIAPERKTDPGPFFDWQRYRSEIEAHQGNTKLTPKNIKILGFPN